jgi:SynChlorMet cassette protein ScmC
MATIMNSLQSQEVRYNFALADGSRWNIAAKDDVVIPIVSQLGRAMRLRAASGIIECSNRGNLRQLLVRAGTCISAANRSLPLASENDNAVVCILSPSNLQGGLYANLVKLSLILAQETQTRGGLLVHGALAERDGMGVILAAPGGTGKTTASNRLPAPWRSLSDDTTLVVRDLHGNYCAHPWPTWSRFLNGETGGVWNVQKAVPVKGIFFLIQAANDQVEAIGPGQAVCLLGESVEQASAFMNLGKCKENLRTQHLERFNNLCTFAKIVPAHLLRISLTGSFWQEMEKVL